MSTNAQVLANRNNAKLSTGPKSEAGKSKSRANSLRSGIDAAGETILPAENPNDLAQLQSEYMDRYDPITPEERCLVDTLINSDWLLRRFRRIEAQLLTKSCQQLTDDPFALGTAFEQNDRALERLQRRVNATTKIYRQTLELLKHLLKDRPSEPVERIQPQPAQSPEPEIGFVPQASETPAPSPTATPTAALLRLHRVTI